METKTEEKKPEIKTEEKKDKKIEVTKDLPKKGFRLFKREDQQFL